MPVCLVKIDHPALSDLLHIGRRFQQATSHFMELCSMLRVEFQIQGFQMSIGTIILIILVIALLGGFSGIGGGPFYGTGYYGGGGLGLIIIVLLVLVLMGRL